MQYLFNILISIDQLANALLGGYPDETISSRVGKLAAQKNCLLCRWFCVLLDKLDKNHCASSIEEDEGDTSADKISHQ